MAQVGIEKIRLKQHALVREWHLLYIFLNCLSKNSCLHTAANLWRAEGVIMSFCWRKDSLNFLITATCLIILSLAKREDSLAGTTWIHHLKYFILMHDHADEVYIFLGSGAASREKVIIRVDDVERWVWMLWVPVLSTTGSTTFESRWHLFRATRRKFSLFFFFFFYHPEQRDRSSLSAWDKPDPVKRVTWQAIVTAIRNAVPKCMEFLIENDARVISAGDSISVYLSVWMRKSPGHFVRRINIWSICAQVEYTCILFI